MARPRRRKVNTPPPKPTGPWIRCARCREQAFMTDWRPGAGLEPRLRQFVCEGGHLTYAIRAAT